MFSFCRIYSELKYGVSCPLCISHVVLLPVCRREKQQRTMNKMRTMCYFEFLRNAANLATYEFRHWLAQFVISNVCRSQCQQTLTLTSRPSCWLRERSSEDFKSGRHVSCVFDNDVTGHLDDPTQTSMSLSSRPRLMLRPWNKRKPWRVYILSLVIAVVALNVACYVVLAFSCILDCRCYSISSLLPSLCCLFAALRTVAKRCKIL